MNKFVVVKDGNCPFCHCSDVKKHNPGHQSGTPNNFRIVSDKVCESCGAIWSPPVPNWLSVLTVLFGVMLLLVVATGSFFWLIDSRHISKFGKLATVLFVILSCGIIWTGVRSLIRPKDVAQVRLHPNEVESVN